MPERNRTIVKTLIADILRRHPDGISANELLQDLQADVRDHPGIAAGGPHRRSAELLPGWENMVAFALADLG